MCRMLRTALRISRKLVLRGCLPGAKQPMHTCLLNCPRSLLLPNPLSRPTQDALLDTFKLEYLVPIVAVLSLIINYAFTPSEILWSFSIWLESVAILPQLFMLQRTGEAETITTHYLAALGLYRGLYIPNWIYR